MNNIKNFKPNTLSYIDHIDEILSYLDLTLDDKKNIHEYIIGLEDGFLREIDGIDDELDYEEINGLIDLSIEVLEDSYEIDYEDDTCEISKAHKSLKIFQKLCPKNLHIHRKKSHGKI